ncbi:MAG: hypothetical protein N3D12_00895 [Candidatus Methanomethyliaceae archaeon]|nr:hypothetical protein [Candidatus Methanomethyliaceae archaeon]
MGEILILDLMPGYRKEWHDLHMKYFQYFGMRTFVLLDICIAISTYLSESAGLE